PGVWKSGTAIQTPDYDDTSTPEILNPSWMTSIPDVYSLSDVTMPECNSWSLAFQLCAGIRFLDIRIRHAKGNLIIHHGISYQYAHFGDVLMDVVAFLREFPSETDIYGAVVHYINEYVHWGMLWHSHEMPSMGEAREKLVVLQDFTGPDLGIRYNSLDIADDWKPEEVEKKWRSVSTHLEAAAVGYVGQRKRFGIVAMDFPGAKLVQTIIGFNY
uniref:Phosphatidylinositol-specific phospholipase C X domain-containing protein n=1 Tax=Sinocyclocheilus grahami TaxID=75366 RepID=A0A672P2L1_SINGR